MITAIASLAVICALNIYLAIAPARHLSASALSSLIAPSADIIGRNRAATLKIIMQKVSDMVKEHSAPDQHASTVLGGYPCLITPRIGR